MVITVELYKEIRQMRQRGCSQRNIATHLQISRSTVKKYWDGDTVPWERKAYQRGANVLTEQVKKFIQGCLTQDEEMRYSKANAYC